MERETIENEVYKLMREFGHPSYNVSYVSNMISDKLIGVHQLTFHVRLSGGVFIIDLNYDQGIFNYTYEHSYANGFTSADHKEIYETGLYFDQKIDAVKMIELFSKF